MLGVLIHALGELEYLLLRLFMEIFYVRVDDFTELKRCQRIVLHVILIGLTKRCCNFTPDNFSDLNCMWGSTFFISKGGSNDSFNSSQIIWLILLKTYQYRFVGFNLLIKTLLTEYFEKEFCYTYLQIGNFILNMYFFKTISLEFLEVTFNLN